MTAIRILVVRTGGFANVRRTAEVDDPAEAERLSAAVRRSAEAPADDRVRDRFTWEVTVVTATGTSTYDLADSQLGEDLRPRLAAALAERPGSATGSDPG